MSHPTSAAGERLMDYSQSRLVAVFNTHPDVQATASDLEAAGFAQSFDVHCGPAGARLIDFSGEEHGPLARLSHALHQLTIEGAHMEHYEHALQAGHCVIMVMTDGAERRQRAQEILVAHGGQFVNQFGPLMVETIEP
jgi:hypothetical protein